jgi:hypothetical protein
LEGLTGGLAAAVPVVLDVQGGERCHERGKVADRIVAALA